MCDPRIYVAMAGMQAVSGVSQGKAEQKTAEANAALLRTQAQQELAAGAYEAQRRASQTRQTIGTQRALYGASGAVVGAGTPLAVTSDTAAIGAEDEAMIRQNAARRAWGLEEQAKQVRYAGKMAKRQAITQGFTTALGSAAKAYETAQYLKTRQPTTKKSTSV